MNKKETTPGVTSTEGSEQETASLAGETISDVYFSTSSGPISSVLGATNAHFTAKQLAKTLGVSDARIITKQIERERKGGGAPICASCGENPGYFMPQNRKELETYIRSLKRRHKAISQTISGMELALDRLTGQKRILEIDETEAKNE